MSGYIKIVMYYLQDYMHCSFCWYSWNINKTNNACNLAYSWTSRTAWGLQRSPEPSSKQLVPMLLHCSGYAPDFRPSNDTGPKKFEMNYSLVRRNFFQMTHRWWVKCILLSVISRRLPTMNSVGFIYILHHTIHSLYRM
jgi:hypothetical protein